MGGNWLVLCGLLLLEFFGDVESRQLLRESSAPRGGLTALEQHLRATAGPHITQAPPVLTLPHNRIGVKTRDNSDRFSEALAVDRNGRRPRFSGRVSQGGVGEGDFGYDGRLVVVVQVVELTFALPLILAGPL